MSKPIRLPAAVVITLLLLLTQGATARAPGLPNFPALVKENSSAVVNVSTARDLPAEQFTEMRGPQFPKLPEGSPFNDFFKRFFEGRPEAPPDGKVRSLGSGFIISEDGYILTNAHVVKDADEISVRLSDHREKPARVLGLDERTDVALLKIEVQGLKAVKFGDSDTLEVGDWVLAIGSPFGLELTATQGIVSALGRNLPSDTYVPFIQTDVAVNPGNSGGPLFNTEGEVVGINSQIYSNSGGYMGLSFAIPINVALQVSDQLKSNGHVTRGWLGVMIQPVNQDLAESFGLERPTGALVSAVVPEGPADTAGLKAGDIIVKYNADMVDQASTLPPLVGATLVGDVIPVTIMRDRKKKTLFVTIQTLPDDDNYATKLAANDANSYPFNMAVTNLSAKQRGDLGPNGHGVLVNKVDGGPAADAGIRAGDVLVAIDHNDVYNVDQLVELLNNLPTGKPVPVLIERDHQPLFLALTVPNA